MFSVTKEDGKIKLKFSPEKLSILKNVPFIIVCLFIIPCLFYIISFFISAFMFIGLCVQTGIFSAVEYNAFFRFSFAFLMALMCFDICVIYQLFPNIPIFKHFNTNCLKKEFGNIQGYFIYFFLFMQISTFYFVGFVEVFNPNIEYFLIGLLKVSFSVLLLMAYMMHLVLLVLGNAFYLQEIIFGEEDKK